MLAEGIPGGFSSLYDSFASLETIGVVRRGYFIEGLGGAQFALPGAVERLRAQRDDDKARPVVLAATDPAQPYGAVLKWPQRENRSPSRSAGAYVVLAGGEPVLYVERGGKGLQVLVDDLDERIGPALAELADAVHRGRIKRLASSASTASRWSARSGRARCSSSASAPARASSPSPRDRDGRAGFGQAGGIGADVDERVAARQVRHGDREPPVRFLDPGARTGDRELRVGRVERPREGRRWAVRPSR